MLFLFIIIQWKKKNKLYKICKKKCYFKEDLIYKYLYGPEYQRTINK